MYAHSSISIAMLIMKAWGKEVGEVEEGIWKLNMMCREVKCPTPIE